MNVGQEVFGDNLVMWNLLVGFFIPPVLAVIQQPGWSGAVRAMVTFIACCLTAIVVIALDDTVSLEFDTWIISALTILVTAISTYQSLWKPTGITPAIEGVTSPK